VIQPFDTTHLVRVESTCGDIFSLEVPSLQVDDVISRIEKKIPDISIVKLFTSDKVYETGESVDVSETITMQYMLNGGGGNPTCSPIYKIPQALQLKIFCFKWGVQDFPDLLSDWICDGVCCCIYNKFGLPELLTTQIFCLGPCTIGSNMTCHTTFKIPELLTLNLLCYKCGCQDFPDCFKEDFIRHKYLCLRHEFGLVNCMKEFQIFCCHVDCGFLNIVPW